MSMFVHVPRTELEEKYVEEERQLIDAILHGSAFLEGGEYVLPDLTDEEERLIEQILTAREMDRVLGAATKGVI